MKNMLDRISFNVGTTDILTKMPTIKAVQPFNERVCSFLYSLSALIMYDKQAKLYSDVITYAFWIRKASVEAMKKTLPYTDNGFRLGRGVVFHISPSNVPVNFAYSMTAGLLLGNANIVRIPSKEFVQVNILCDAINSLFASGDYDDIRAYLVLIKYGHDSEINDYLSSICDVRVIWGGDNTISEIRKSQLPPRSTEITFADRYSLAVIDSDSYLETSDKANVARDFYNDTYLTDQNACTSPKIVVWMGNSIEIAKHDFWNNLYEIVSNKYSIQPIQAVDKLTNMYKAAAGLNDAKEVVMKDNLITRVKVSTLSSNISDYMGNSGFFFEYDCNDINELLEICDALKCQTIGYIGSSNIFCGLINNGIKGVDRIVPIGKTMDFGLIWDGYDLKSVLTRRIYVK